MYIFYHKQSGGSLWCWMDQQILDLRILDEINEAINRVIKDNFSR